MSLGQRCTGAPWPNGGSIVAHFNICICVPLRRFEHGLFSRNFCSGAVEFSLLVCPSYFCPVTALAGPSLSLMAILCRCCGKVPIAATKVFNDFDIARRETAYKLIDGKVQMLNFYFSFMRTLRRKPHFHFYMEEK